MTFIKYFTTFIFVSFLFISGFAQSVLLDSQTDVDAFNPSTTTLPDLLRIRTTNPSDPITDLSNLANLTSIGGTLSIYENPTLTNIDELSNITFIGGYLSIEYNAALTNLDGLANVTSIGGGLWVNSNAALTNIDGLANITSVPQDLKINFNAALTNIDGLSNIISTGSSLSIQENAALTDCCGIQSLLNTPGGIPSTSTIDIYNNPSECDSENQVINTECGISINLIKNPPCINTNNGSIQVGVNNFDAGPFNYTWENTASGETGGNISQSEFFTIENLATGTYDITVSEPNQDPIIQTGIVLSEIPGSVFEIIEITSTNSSNNQNNGSLALIIAGGTAPYAYNWSGQSSGTANNINDNNYNISNLSQGTYDITVSDNIGNEQVVSVSLLDETVPAFPCDQPLDIVILNDVSGSVDEIEYSDSKQFFIDFLNEVNIGLGTDDSRAAMIEWSDSDEQSIKIPITGVAADLQDYETMSRSFSGGTDPQSAMNFGKDYLDAVARPGVEKVLVLSTDAASYQVSPSLIALADEFKAEGYHIITIAFDDAFSNNDTRDILRQVASIDLLAPGAAAYSQLDQNLAQNIVSLYLCPIDPGSSATVYFNRDGEIQITEIQPVGSCPSPNAVEITFTVEAKRELSLPSGTAISFYYNNPELFGSTAILTWIIPCAIPAGTTETFTVTLPVSTAANIYAVLNDDGSQPPAIGFPITDIEELAYSNNIDNISICTEPVATLQALKYTTTPSPICNNTVMYTVDVCNISPVDATDVTITDVAPADFILQGTSINTNGCTTDNGTSFDIPADCCVSIIYTYDASAAANDYYSDQDVNLDGPEGQTYIGFDGIGTTAEDVLIDGTSDCPSSTISFSKQVHTSNTCEDAFVVYTFTIDNQLNVPIQGLQFTDVLPDPVNWTFQPYDMQGLSISTSSVTGNTASFTIDEINANTAASFSMDASLGDWMADAVLTNTATLANVPDLDNGGFQTLTSNSTTTNVSTTPEITLPDTLYIETTETMVSLDASLTGATNIGWTTVGDGIFSSTDASATSYTFGTNDFMNGEVSLFVSTISDCGQDGQNVLVILVPPCEIVIDNITIGNCNDNGTNTDAIDDTYDISINATVINGSANNTYGLSDGTNTYGPFTYGQDESITLPADGNTYTLVFTDSDNDICTNQTDVSQNSCSNTCLLSIDDATVGICNDNGTDIDSTDDTYDVSINASAVNAGISGTYEVHDGTNTYGPFVYGTSETITLPADGNAYDLIFTDSDDIACFAETQVSRNSCSNTCFLEIIDAIVGACNPNGTVSDASDDSYEVNVDVSAQNPGISNQFTVSEGTNILGTFTYNEGGSITLPADGNSYTITFTDADDSSCIVETQVSRNSCSNSCLLVLSDIAIGNCSDNGTEMDATDDIFDLSIIINGLNAGISGTYEINDGLDEYGPFDYGIIQNITLPADGNIHNLMINDTDDASCTIETQISQNPCSCIFNAFFHLQQPLCEGDLSGAFIIDSLEGGIGPFSYSLDNENFYPLDSITSLYIGDYGFYIMDEASPDCIHQFTFSIEDPMPFYVNIGEDRTIGLGNSVPILMTSTIPLGQLDWTWSDTSSLTCTNCINPTATPLTSTSYILEAVNRDGCTAVDTLNIKVIEDYNIYIPNAFTPNEDGANDLFKVYPGIGISEIRSIKLFSRWGELVYSQGAYNPHDVSSFDRGWDGSFNGKTMNQNVFVYMVEFRLANGKPILLTGDVTLIR